MLACHLRWSCRMRSLALAVAVAAIPSLASAQIAPRSLALEVGIAREIGSGAALRAPVALAASWWIGERLDLTARVGWASAARTDGRAADTSADVGGGLRWTLGAAPFRTALLTDIAVVKVLGRSLVDGDGGLRARAGGSVDLFFARDLALGVAMTAGAALLSSGTSRAEVGLALRVEGYF
jgi:hypothetical protein